MNFGEESEFIEHKVSTAELPEALVAICAMLNKHGSGTVYFGVRDDGEAVGFPCGKESENDIKRRIDQRIDPAPTVTTALTRIGDGTKAVIEVRFSGNRPPYQCSGRFYMRNGRSDQLMTSEELERFILERRKNYTDWENEVGNQGIDSLSEALIRETYDRNSDIHRHYPEYPGKEKTLRFFGLLTKDGVPNASAVALYGNRPISLKTAVFRGFDRSEAINMDISRGNILELIPKAMEFALSSIDSSYVNSGALERGIEYEIPAEAIREIVVNSFAHADYSSNTAHQVFIYKDRLSIYNPGYFPAGLRPEDYENGILDPVERNPKIYDVLHTFGYVETYAMGLRKTFEVCRKTKTTIGYEQTTQGGFRFEFYRKGDTIYPIFREEDTIEERILILLMRNSYFSVETLAKRLGKSKGTVFAKLKTLVEQGKVKRIGSDKTGYWVVTRN